MKKGSHTRTTILDRAFEVARRDGLEALTIGSLALAAEMSKSGLFAHFESRSNLQRAVLEYASGVFSEQVVRPTVAVERGAPQLRALMENWLAWAKSKYVDGGCVFLAAAAELDDAEGPVRDSLVTAQTIWLETLWRIVQTGKDEGHFRADLDCDLAAYQFYANMMGYHFYARLMRDTEAESRARRTFDVMMATWK